VVFDEAPSRVRRMFIAWKAPELIIDALGSVIPCSKALL